MSKALSFDLRTRVLGTVAGGLSHRQAGDPFDVSAPVWVVGGHMSARTAILVPRRSAMIDGRDASTPARD